MMTLFTNGQGGVLNDRPTPTLWGDTLGERRRLGSVAVVIAIALHGLVVWWLWSRENYQPVLLPKQRIEISLVAPSRPVPVATKPVIKPPVPAKPLQVKPQPPKSQSPKLQPHPQPHPQTAKRSDEGIKHVVKEEEKPIPPVVEPVPVPVEPELQQEPQSLAVPEPSVQPAEVDPSPVAPAAPQSVVQAEPVSPPTFDAAYLNNPKPVYPAAARRMGLEGLVLLRVRVDAQGKPVDVTVITSSGSTILDKSAVKSVIEQWTFVPAHQGERAIEGVVDVPIHFSLR